jgi:hypothetical protein
MKFNLPADTQRTITSIHALIDRRREADGLDRDLALQERTAAEGVKHARGALDTIETDLALARRGGDQAQIDETIAARSGASEKVQSTEINLERVQRARRGLATRRSTLDDEIERADPAVADALQTVRQTVITAWREELRSSIAGPGPGLIAALRTGYALNAAIGVPSRDLLNEISIKDPCSPAVPVRRLLDGARNFSAPADGEFIEKAEDLVMSWRDVPDLAALHELLAPIGTLAHEIGMIARKVRDTRERERDHLTTPQAPKTPQRAPQPDLAAMSADEYRAHRAAEVNASRVYRPFDPSEHNYGGIRGRA